MPHDATAFAVTKYLKIETGKDHMDTSEDPISPLNNMPPTSRNNFCSCTLREGASNCVGTALCPRTFEEFQKSTWTHNTLSNDKNVNATTCNNYI